MLSQLIPSEFCLKCDVCCRYSEKKSAYAAFFLPDEISNPAYFKRIDKSHGCQISLVPYADIYKCPHFLTSNNKCKIYSKRPLDCRLYPFLIAYDKEYKSVNLYLDKQCHYIKNGDCPNPNSFLSLKGLSPFFQKIAKNHAFVMPYQKNAAFITRLEKITDEIFKPSCDLAMLGIEHKDIFQRYLKPYSHLGFSTRSFVNIYIWSDLFKILWKIIDDNLCIFYWYGNDFAMLLPPLSKDGSLSEKAVLESIEILKTINKANCRIENIAEHEIKILEECGLEIHKNTDEYIYLTKDIAELKGNRFAKQRSAMNQFAKKWVSPFFCSDIDPCLDLYLAWARQKQQKTNDAAYLQLLEDNFSALNKALMNFEDLGLLVRAVKINGKIHAFTIAFKLNDETYCVLFEITNPAIKGLPQFIFNRLARELKDTKYLNAMDDSGLANLKKTKLSWHPHKILTNYIGIM